MEAPRSASTRSFATVAIALAFAAICHQEVDGASFVPSSPRDPLELGRAYTFIDVLGAPPLPLEASFLAPQTLLLPLPGERGLPDEAWWPSNSSSADIHRAIFLLRSAGASQHVKADESFESSRKGGVTIAGTDTEREATSLVRQSVRNGVLRGATGTLACRDASFTTDAGRGTHDQLVGEAILNPMLNEVTVSSETWVCRGIEALHRYEYSALCAIERRTPTKLFRPVALAVHHSLRPEIVTPLLALVVWLASLPKGASLITFVCASDLVNTIIKWSVQRPRPRWYAKPSKSSAGGGGSRRLTPAPTWEADLSFPSAHTQFFTGIAFAASGLCNLPLAPAIAMGLLAGFTRNYLGVHWITDTLAGFSLGGVLGMAWSRIDLHAWLLRVGDPRLSLVVATAVTACLLGGMITARALVPEVTEKTKAGWYQAAMENLTPAARAALEEKEGDEAIQLVRPRSVRSKIPMLVTVFCALALTGLYPNLLPSASFEPMLSPPVSIGPAHRTKMYNVVQAAVGTIGLGSIKVIKIVANVLVRWTKINKSGKVYGSVQKGGTYAFCCLWTFLLAQRASRALLGYIT